MSDPVASAATARPPSALAHPGFRVFFICVAAVMTADFCEHVISYWVIFDKFKSTWMGGFAVISHWLPFLLLSIPSGALGDRFDPRRIIQVGMAVFASVSIAWGVLFYTGKLEMWHACVLLVIHGLAGVLWNPATQLLLYDMVGPSQLPSAVRLVATGRNLGMLAGPAVGAALLHLGPAQGIFINALIYLPMFLWLWKAPYGPRFRKDAPQPTRAVKGFGDILETLRTVAGNRTLSSMMLLAGGASFFIGNAYQAQMPELAHDLGRGRADFMYAMLIGADAFGAIVAAVVLESRGFLPLTPRTALVLAMIWCGALAGFAMSTFYPIAVALLVVAGFVELSFNSMAQALVQLNAPVPMRARIVGVFVMSALGMRTFSGVMVGVIGAAIGVHYSIALAACVLFVGLVALFLSVTRAAAAGQ
ncbi:MAG: MFS transporter [Gammaproteobacteria bacterium]